ncbi:hypothetical protein D9756_006186 [Leucocoprinus leucothites]|uniref:C2H2-type domain-containing protein n=1 Tax=Leucocoprinus leucothites TaxID=201217 RepID=A0A8H5D2G1_9AGAR|nr:hypothetical protein D9756_006186 [Leucoagaricus leucothites]
MHPSKVCIDLGAETRASSHPPLILLWILKLITRPCLQRFSQPRFLLLFYTPQALHLISMSLAHDPEPEMERGLQQNTPEPSYHSDREAQAPNNVSPDALEAEKPSAEMEDFSRPRTRSQTGTTVKRRLPEELNTPAPQRPAQSRKKPKAATKKSSSPTDAEDSQEGHRTESSLTDSRDVSQATTRSSSPLSLTPPLTFLESSTSPGYAPERRGPRSRATLPVPVPNLTKKSRGRRVPTQEAADAPPEVKDKRMYVCKVEGCGKCFHRGEHLKRHIRSIHTHEKPFMCTHPACGKFFNRHDNLLQHLKVHKQNNREENGNPLPILKLSPPSPSPSPEPEPAMDREADSSESEAEAPLPMGPPLKLTFPVVPVSYDSYMLPPRFEAPCESYSTNMAVSSLRTELPPHSPPISRVRDSL